MEEKIQYRGRVLTLVKQLTDELCTLEDPAAGLKYTSKLVKSPSESRSTSLSKEISFLKTQSLAHPNIISLHSSSMLPTSTTILYEYCNNGPLSSFTSIHPLKTFHEICQGVNFLHSKSIIHNNLSIYTILMADDIPKIAGLEVTTFEELLVNFTSSINNNLLSLTDPNWRAPEIQDQFLPSKESDIWSLGLIFYYILYHKPFDLTIPEGIPQLYKDIFLMTLEKNPARRASVPAILKKIEERNISEPVKANSCGCFGTERVFSCSNSTLALVRKIISSDFSDVKDKYLKRLIKKVWDTPDKMQKFFSELLRLREVKNDTVRIKAYCLLFIYLQKAPVSAFSAHPGVMEVIAYIESNSKAYLSRQRNEKLLRLTHSLGCIIKLKYYVVKSHLMNFNGVFASVSNSIKKFFQDPQVELVNELLEYWDMVLGLHESLISKEIHGDLIKYIRKILADEQENLVELVKMLLLANQAVFEESGVFQSYNLNLDRMKKAFEFDALKLQIDQEVPEILASRSEHVSRSFSSNPGKPRFTPVNLDTENRKSVHSDSQPLKDSNSSLPDYESMFNNLQLQLSSWAIKASELTLLKSIGSGSSCEVWLGLYQKTQVAIKRQKSSDTKHLIEFQREIQVLVHTRHPNLLTFMGLSFEDPISIITEYCAGGTLFNLLHNRRDVFISWQQKLTMLKEIARGMLFLHSKGFVHRDLKSLNVLLTNEVNNPNDCVQIKVADFGLTREVDDEGLMTGKIGTSHWMAPEVLASSNYSAKADVYSYSILMYEVITREVPYKGKKHEEIRTQILLKSLRPDLKIIPPSCPTKLISLMVLCWKQEFEKRPSFSAVLDVLNGISVVAN